jgi:hypothetical protein
MRFEKSIEIEAPQQRVWDVLSDIEAWPQRIETVDSVELLTPAPITTGSRVRLKQPRLPEGTGRARLTLTLDMRGLLIPIMFLFYRKLTNDYMNLEAEGMKRAAEAA